MAYTVKYTDFTNKGAITVNDSTVNTETSIALPGRNQRGYGIAVAENFLHILENFANNTPPENPVEGQVWYDTTLGVEDLKIFDGATWKLAGSIRKSADTPTVGVLGDLWVDTDNQQLYLFNGASWVLVGPTFSSGLRTGVVAEKVFDSDDIERVILSTYIDDEIVSIYSVYAFIPKVAIQGFSRIRSGINISTKDFDNNLVVDTKYWGIAEKAENLIVSGQVIPASTFLRSDVSNITNAGFTVRNDVGIATGRESQLRLSVDSNTIGNISHVSPNSGFEIRINYQGNVTTTLIHADSNGNVGIGVNNLAPEETLDVLGTSRFSDVVKINSVENTTNDVTGALQVVGGVNIQKDLIVRGNANFTGHITVGELETGGLNVAILPQTNNLFKIGTTSNKFAEVHSTTFYGNLVGNIVGNITGNVVGTATNLLAGTTFQLTGDVTAPSFTFDGATGGLIKTFNTSINPNFIDSKPVIEVPNGADTLLLYRPGTGLVKMLRNKFFTQVALIPVGTILPFAGTTIPDGYLLCDGSEKRRDNFPDLFGIIGFTYGDQSFLLGNETFRLPDLRGKFPIGRSSMDNGDQVPSTTGNIDSNTQAMTGTTQSVASTLGNSGGAQNVTLTVPNVPNHQHSLKGDNNTEFYAINNDTGIPNDTGSFVGNGPDAASQGQYIGNTGNMLGYTTPTTPVTVMNPFLTINYIIFTGKFT
jgi:hypothetical protein